MVRASSAGRISSSRPSFDVSLFIKDLTDLRETAKKKKLILEETPEGLQKLCETVGIKTKAVTVKKHLENKKLVESDPLPPGAKGYMKEAWLEANGFMNISAGTGNNATKKGNLCEDDAIVLLSGIDGNNYSKEVKKSSKRFLRRNC